MNIKVIGAGCPNCDQLKANTRAALDQLGLTNEEIQRVSSLKEILLLGIMDAPSLLVDGQLLISGQVATVGEIKAKLQSLLH